jgi:predicted nucleotidyltransferase
MEERFELFLENLISSIVNSYGAAISSMVVYGSFATGKARPGSDLDMLIHLKEGVHKVQVVGINKILLELESEYDLEVAWTLRVPLLRYIHPPIIIFEYSDLYWESICFNNSNLRWTIALSTASKNLFFANIKATGKVVYGENVLERIQSTIRGRDRLFASLMHPVYLLGKSTCKLAYKSFFRNRL